MKTVTALVAQQKNKRRVNLYLDGEYFCSLDLFTAISERLKVGEEVDEKRLAEIVEKAEYSSALDRSLTYISKSMHTKVQVIKYLKDKQYSGKVIRLVIDKLTEYGYVDDEAYAEKYFKEKSACEGKRKIAYELKIKGVDEKVLEAALGDKSDDEEACRIIAEKYIKGRQIDYQLKSKAYRYLLNKGFDYDTAKETLEKLQDETDNS